MLGSGVVSLGNGNEGARKATGASVGRASPVSSYNSLDSPKNDVKAFAQRLTMQVAPKSRPDQWGLLTAVSEKARKRTQGTHIMLHNGEHILGRTVKEVSCQFDSPAVSGRHCTIFRKIVAVDGSSRPFSSVLSPGDRFEVFVKDSSSNGTYINELKLRRGGHELCLKQGDIISLVGSPDHENAFAFVYRDVVDMPSRPGTDEVARQAFKRKSSAADENFDGVTGDGKRVRGLGNGGVDGPVSLDDVRRLQRSNEELRQQIESHVLSIEKMRSEFRAADARHESEVKEVKASVQDKFSKKIEDMSSDLERKVKLLEESKALCAQQQTSIADLNQRLAAAAQSRHDAEEAINSHQNTIEELQQRLEEERNQHDKERAEAEANLKTSLERARAEAVEELKRQSEAAARFQKQQHDMIADLQDADKENRRLAESLRGKLETERQALIGAEEKGRRLEGQLKEEQVATENARKKAAVLEEELRQVCKELEGEKAARESARSKVESLELDMEAAIRDLALEKQRLQGARERIVLRETQLRAFHSTAAQIEALQQKQQEQLKAMLRTLEQEESGDPNIRRLTTNARKSKEGDHVREVEDSAQKSLSSSQQQMSAELMKTQIIRKDDVYKQTANGDLGSCMGDEHMCDDQEKGTPKASNVRQDEPNWMYGDTQEENDTLAEVPNAGTVVGMAEHEHAIVEKTRKMKGKANFPGGCNEPKVVGELVKYEKRGTKSLCNERRSGDPGPSNQKFELRFQTALVDKTHEGGLNHDNPPVTENLSEESHQAENDEIALLGGETMLMDDDDIPEHVSNDSGGTEGGEDNPELLFKVGDTVVGDSPPGTPSLPAQGSRALSVLCRNFTIHNQVDGCSVNNEVNRISNVTVDEHRVLGGHPEFRRDMENSMNTADLLASEVAGSWGLSTPPSGHADNESFGNEEGNQQPEELQRVIEEGASQVAAPHGPDRTRQRESPRQPSSLEDTLYLGNPLNSQSSLSPYNLQEEREALHEMLDIVDPGFSRLHRIASVVIRQNSDDEGSTTDDGEDHDDDTVKEVDITSEASHPVSSI